MLGNIGGTFGVFLGLSFLSLVEEIVEVLGFIKNNVLRKKGKNLVFEL